jgi:spermidine/putrescine transport system permease protein
MEKHRPSAPIFAFGIFGLVIFFLYLPICYLVFGSFVEQNGEQWFFSLRWYTEIFKDQVLQEALLRSLLVAALSSAIATILGAFAAIALQRSKFKAQKVLELMSLISLVMPELIFALSLLSWFFIFKLQLSLTTVIAAHVTFSLSFVMLTVSSRLSSMDQSIEQAAEDLGATPWQVLWRVILPLLKPALGAAYILSFLLSFDDFLITFFTGGVGSDTLPIKLYASMKLGHSPKLNALSSLMICFSVVIIAFLLRSKVVKDLIRPRP